MGDTAAASSTAQQDVIMAVDPPALTAAASPDTHDPALFVFGQQPPKGRSVMFSPGTSCGDASSRRGSSRPRSTLYVTVKLTIEERSLILLLIARFGLILQGFKNLNIDF